MSLKPNTIKKKDLTFLPVYISATHKKSSETFYKIKVQNKSRPALTTACSLTSFELYQVTYGRTDNVSGLIQGILTTLNDSCCKIYVAKEVRDICMYGKIKGN